MRLNPGAGASARKWKVITFSETRGAELLAIKDGEAVALTGKFDVKPYEWHGETRLDFTLFVETIAPLRPVPKRKKEPSPTPATSPAPPLARRAPSRNGFASHGCDGTDHFGDDVPF